MSVSSMAEVADRVGHIRKALTTVYSQTDAEVASAITSDKLHRGTALFVLKQFAIEVEKIDPEFGAKLIATHTEEAVRPNERLQEGSAVMSADTVELFLTESRDGFAVIRAFRGGKCFRMSTGRVETLRAHMSKCFPGVRINEFAPVRVVCSYCAAVIRDVISTEVSHGVAIRRAHRR